MTWAIQKLTLRNSLYENMIVLGENARGQGVMEHSAASTADCRRCCVYPGERFTAEQPWPARGIFVEQSFS